jgi:hypothetical protein
VSPSGADRSPFHPPQPAQAWLVGLGRSHCFTDIADPRRLAQIADTLPQDAAVGRLGQVCDRWIYWACLCFGLDLAGQARSGFRYACSACQAGYSRNLIFGDGRQLDRVSNTVAGRTRSRLDVPTLRTLSGARRRPGKYAAHDLSPAWVW